ncbi:RagB/SusD family nutrient uptake outer membrane protein [Mucilaginibacter litoreus]|uniref:RagB/SusD family nutrient uptake outer membrane protein n=1 Tax=Mucilaginibacter litoreus TaxID=1048221 RepID=A0ABW3ARH5_9SPHI
MKILKISSIIILVLTVSACKKFLDLKPQSDISDFAYWQTANDYRLAANWFYDYSLDDPHYSGAYMNDNNSDIAFGAEVNTISSGKYVAPEQDDNWDNSYAAIRNANKLIEQGTASAIKNDIKPFLGEGYFFRAYSYFRLLDLYGGVPIIDKVLQPNDPLVFSARATREEVVNFIIADLNTAIANLPVKASAEKGRISKEAAQAFKARVCLFEGTWRKFHVTGDANDLLDQAITESKNVINSGAFSLNTMRSDSSYRLMFIDNYSMDNPETIVSKKYRTNINVNGWAYGVSWGNLNPTKAAADMYLCKDGLPVDKSPLFRGYDSARTEFRNRDPRMTQSLILPAIKIIRPQYDKYRPQWPGVDNNRNVNSGYMLYKFISQMATPGDGGGAFDWNVIRYGEVLAIYAEATYERNGSISDADLDMSINLLRDRVHMPHLTNALVSANGLDMRNEIRRERTVELAFEGFRWDDLRRWKTAETVLPKSVLSVKVTGSEWSKKVVTLDGANYNSYFYNTPAAQLENGFKVLQPGSQRAFDVNKNYLLPIPTKQISLNPDKLKQNPGW